VPSVFLLYFRNVILRIILGSYFFVGVTCLSSLVGSSEVLAEDVVPVEMTIQDKKDLKRVAVYWEAIKTLRGGLYKFLRAAACLLGKYLCPDLGVCDLNMTRQSRY